QGTGDRAGDSSGDGLPSVLNGSPALPTAVNAPLLAEGCLGPLATRNRLIRAGTSETMASSDGAVSDDLVSLYRVLAQSGVGAIFTGHLYCHQRGKYLRAQTGIYNDRLMSGLRRLTDVVHASGGLVLAQLAHAGSQSRDAGVRPVAPSEVA